jgi:hypothetical protein
MTAIDITTVSLKAFEGDPRLNQNWKAAHGPAMAAATPLKIHPNVARLVGSERNVQMQRSTLAFPSAVNECNRAAYSIGYESGPPDDRRCRVCIRTFPAALQERRKARRCRDGALAL